MQVNSEEEWICYGVFWGPMPSSFRTQFWKTPLQCNQLTCSTCLSTGHHSQRAHSPGRDSGTVVCTPAVWRCFWGCFQQWSISIASLLRQKSTGPKDFTNRHYITQPICVYGRLPECICAIPNLHTVELHVCTQLPAFKPLSKGAQWVKGIHFVPSYFFLIKKIKFITSSCFVSVVMTNTLSQNNFWRERVCPISGNSSFLKEVKAGTKA